MHDGARPEYKGDFVTVSHHSKQVATQNKLYDIFFLLASINFVFNLTMMSVSHNM